ncbi:MAG TPA: Uma2 family endonuclease [Planctomycetaceae bacterium]
MSTIVIADTGCIPDWVGDLDSFRRWARSDEFPESGTFSYLDGEIWVDVSMEQLFTHNQVKAAITGPLVVLVQQLRCGRFVPDRMLFSNVATNLSTEPDGLYFDWSTVQSGQLKFVEGADGGFVELEGTPDMVLEVVSRTSVQKDTVVLRDKYWQAGIPEYWLVDARGPNLSFEILQYTSEGYITAPTTTDGNFSKVFNRSFRMSKRMDPLGNPEFIVEHSAS